MFYKQEDHAESAWRALHSTNITEIIVQSIALKQEYRQNKLPFQGSKVRYLSYNLFLVRGLRVLGLEEEAFALYHAMIDGAIVTEERSLIDWERAACE